MPSITCCILWRKLNFLLSSRSNPTFKALSPREILRNPLATISFPFDKFPIAASATRAFQNDCCNVTERKSTQFKAFCMLIFTLDIMGLDEFRERSMFSATPPADKWEVAQSIELLHKSWRKKWIRRDPTFPFDAAILGFIQLDTFCILHTNNITGHLEICGSSTL